jgi:hypothetical protein
MQALANPDLQHAARRRVGMKLGVAIHALVFVVVNAGLSLLNASLGGYHWAVWPLAGWGLGLAIHAGVIGLVLSTGDWKRRMIEREAEKLRAHA